MSTNPSEHLSRIRRFDQLVAYLRDDLDWPIGSGDFEDLTFDYTPEELGIDTKNAAKIQGIKRLRPLTPNQPWGIFFVKFEPKRLPVVALRSILGRVALKKRASANHAERPSWAMEDLLFISNYGEGDSRQISIAHFEVPDGSTKLPTLKVLGWDDRDTPLHLDAVARELTEYLSWPDDQNDTNAWRQQWRSAFTLDYQEVVTTSRQLAIRLAALARATRNRIHSALEIETENGPITQLMKAFRSALVQDLDQYGFADMVAQTITYGLLSARIADPHKSTAEDLADHMRTNPLLRDLMTTFLQLGGSGRGTGIDFDELGVSEVVTLLDRANMDAVVRDFGDLNPREDPVIHFYEHFLSAYDKEQKVSRGVYYTPRPVVSYIVRSVDHLLRADFGLEDGLANTTTWGEMVKRHKKLKIPEDTPPEQAFVQILDPATGTGTFLVEVIDLIHKTMVEKWKGQGHNEKRIQKLWNEYIPKHLLPRLHGYELLMAPYAVAHLKIGLKLYETGYRFESNERANVYLTNALEPPGQVQFTFDFLPALAYEAAAVNEVKLKRRFTVVIGNPPYSGLSSNMNPWINGLLKGRLPKDTETTSYYHIDGKPLKERKVWLQADYVKFIRLSQWLLDSTGVGVHGYISNHSYLYSPTFRGMRRSLMQSFQRVRVLDLHGYLKEKEIPPGGGHDVNVFDIQQGVAIGLFTKAATASGFVCHADLWGERGQKYRWLWQHSSADTEWVQLKLRPPFYLFEPFDDAETGAYSDWPAINELMPVNSVGIVTARDHLTIHFDPETAWETVCDFSRIGEEEARARYRLRRDVQSWKVRWAQDDVRGSGPSKSHLAPIVYRPFDQRWTYYTGKSSGFICRPMGDLMPHMIVGENQALCIGRAGQVIGSSVWDVLLASGIPSDFNLFRRGGNCLFPLYLYPGIGNAAGSLFNRWTKGKADRIPNLESVFVEQIATSTQLRFVSDGSGNLQKTFGPENVLAWIYAVFHSPGFRQRYEAHLKLDFPRVPLPGDGSLFHYLVKLGQEILALHLLESSQVGKAITVYSGSRNPVVGRVGWSDDTVWLDARKTIARKGHRATKPGTIGFQGVPEKVWDFHIGGYQVCHKWLKDRKDRVLSDEDVTHYQKIIVALNETIRIMAEIDEVIETHGGWPDAFWTGSKADAESEKTTKVVPIRPRSVEPAPEDRYVTCVPLVPLRAAAGGFSDPQHIEDDYFDWVAVKSRYPLAKGHVRSSSHWQIYGAPDPRQCLVPIQGSGHRYAPRQDSPRPASRRYRPGNRTALHRPSVI